MSIQVSLDFERVSTDIAIKLYFQMHPLLMILKKPFSLKFFITFITEEGTYILDFYMLMHLSLCFQTFPTFRTNQRKINRISSNEPAI